MSDKQLSYAAAEMQVSYCGNCYNSMRLLKDKIYKHIVLLCYKEPKKLEQLCQDLQTGSEFIKDALADLQREGLLEKNEELYSTKFPMFHEYNEFRATEVVNKILLKNNIPQRINDMLLSKKKEISELDFYGNNFDIKYLNGFLYAIVNELLMEKIRAFYLDKTDEIVIDKKYWQTQNYDFSHKIMYRYPDEKPAEQTATNRLDSTNGYSTYIGDILVNVAFDLEEESKRIGFLDAKNILTYLKLAENPAANLDENESDYVKALVENGVLAKNGEGYVPMIPVLTESVLREIKKLLEKEVIEFAKEIVGDAGNEVEAILLPELYGKKSRIDQFYVFWLCYLLSPLQELNWFGMNQGGFELPKDFNKSVLGIYIVK